ncbi:probable inactive dual specificity protein phosphatase-like At4g18593 [Cyclospora cayetanensis]|uniref:protein-tyrosine-phosphatase n=1 Tax=Cyclospora cayetanensis TaxID=88456 RepID=A0A6P6RTV1_9EIME|nr:probable inactive dual specificity protein phosphatase-like At4g18593 [Cyclospora cayetanensis]
MEPSKSNHQLPEQRAHGEAAAGLPTHSGLPDTQCAVYCCRCCRYQLFYESQLQPHEPKPQGESKTGLRAAPPPKCTSAFVEPLQWMRGLEEQRGKLICPNPAVGVAAAAATAAITLPQSATARRCGAKLGNWCWAGLKCSCGQWNAPAFQVSPTQLLGCLSEKGVRLAAFAAASSGKRPTPVPVAATEGVAAAVNSHAGNTPDVQGLCVFSGTPLPS